MPLWNEPLAGTSSQARVDVAVGSGSSGSGSGSSGSGVVGGRLVVGGGGSTGVWGGARLKLLGQTQ